MEPEPIAQRTGRCRTVPPRRLTSPTGPARESNLCSNSRLTPAVLATTVPDVGLQQRVTWEGGSSEGTGMGLVRVATAAGSRPESRQIRRMSPELP